MVFFGKVILPSSQMGHETLTLLDCWLTCIYDLHNALITDQLFGRYPNLNMSCIKPHQVQHLFNGYVDPKEMEEVPIERPAKRPCTLETGTMITSDIAATLFRIMLLIFYFPTVVDFKERELQMMFQCLELLPF